MWSDFIYIVETYLVLGFALLFALSLLTKKSILVSATLLGLYGLLWLIMEPLFQSPSVKHIYYLVIAAACVTATLIIEFVEPEKPRSTRIIQYLLFIAVLLLTFKYIDVWFMPNYRFSEYSELMILIDCAVFGMTFYPQKAALIELAKKIGNSINGIFRALTFNRP